MGLFTSVLAKIGGSLDAANREKLLYVVVSFILGYFACYYFQVVDLQKEVSVQKTRIEVLEKTVESYQNADTYRVPVASDTKTEVSYVDKASRDDADVQMTTGSKIKVSLNGTMTDIPSNVTENSKFENGKLVFDTKQTSVIDLTETFNKTVMAERKDAAREASRTGKFNPGMIGVKDGDSWTFMPGVQLEAKMFSVGVYHEISDSQVGFSLHGKF